MARIVSGRFRSSKGDGIPQGGADKRFLNGLRQPSAHWLRWLLSASDPISDGGHDLGAKPHAEGDPGR